MADESNDTEKTEEPTQKRLEEALKRGDVVKSQEVNTWFVIAGAALVSDGVLRLNEQRPDHDDARAYRQFLQHQRRWSALCRGCFRKSAAR